VIPEAPPEQTGEGLVADSRENQTVDEVARRYGASVEAETQDSEVAYASVPESERTRYRDGWLPS
jgi:hypothetical protein